MKVHEDNYDFAELARRLVACRVSAPGEPFSYTGDGFDLVISILESRVEFAPEIPEIDRRALVHKAAIGAGTQATCEKGDLLRHLRQAESEYLSKPVADYVLAASVAIRPFRALHAVKIYGSRIVFGRTLPAAFDRSPIQSQLDEYIDGTPRDIASVRVGISARTYVAALDQALERLDLLRSFWNFALNTRTIWRVSASDQPVNEVLLGPVFTIHTPDGALASTQFWRERQPLKADWVYNLQKDWPNVARSAVAGRRRLRRIEYARELEAVFIRYTRALDYAEYDVSFNRLWAVLEHLTGSVGDYKLLIKRALFLYSSEDQNFARQLLQHLRDVRNGSVHKDHQRTAIETYLYQLKRVVERALRFHFHAGPRFSSLSQAAEILSLPTGASALQRRIDDHQFALSLRT